MPQGWAFKCRARTGRLGMEKKSEYAILADQAQRLSDEAPDRHFAESWRLIASGFRQLSRLHALTLQRWRRQGWDEFQRDAPEHGPKH